MPIFNQYDPGTASTFQYDTSAQKAIDEAKKKQRTAKILNTGVGIAEIAGGAALMATGAGAAVGAPIIMAGLGQTASGLSMGNGGYMPAIPERMTQNYYQERPAAYYNPYTAPYDPNEQFDMGAVPAPVMPVNNYTNPRQQWADEINERARLLREPQDLRDVEMTQPKEKSLEGFYWESPKTKNTSGYYRLGNGGMVNGGSHKSGHDLAIVDKNTGGDTGIRVEGGEMVVSKERTNALKHAYNQNDYNAVMRIIGEQMRNGINAHKLDDGTGALNFTNWGAGTQPNNAVNDFNLTNASLGVLQPNIELAGTPTLRDNYGMTPKDYGIIQRQNPEMQYLQDYNTIGTYAKTNPTTPSDIPTASGSWMDYIKYAIPAIQTGLGAYASQATKLPEFTPPAEFNAMMALHKRQSGEGLSAQENMLLDRAIQDTYTTGLNKIYGSSGGNAGAILGNQNALAGDVLNAKIKQAALNADQRRKNQDTYAEDVAKQLSLLQDAYKLKYAQAAGARAAGGNLMGVGLNNAQDMMTADALKKAGESQDNTFAKSLEEYFKNKK